jgi:5-methylcytosine-specific restriction endonuclease McrA
MVLPVGIGRGSIGHALIARGIEVDRLATSAEEHRNLWESIRNAGRFPSVARLVMDTQRQYWAENPEANKEHQRQRSLNSHRWRYLADPEYRLYHRQKSKRRKAQERGSIGVHVKGKRIRERFAQFGHQCAYCGATGDLQIEHLIPIAKGGAHVLGNILPACRRCNYSKTTHEAEAWYRSQSFFCERRWQKIRRVLGLGKGAATQVSLL